MNPLILYKNLIKTANSVYASSTAGGFSVLNLMDERPYTYWKAGVGGQQVITVTLNSPQSVDCMGICSHNLKGAYVEFQAYTSYWQTIAAKTAGEFSVVLKGQQVYASQFRIVFTAGVSAYIGVLSLGKAIVFPERPQAPYNPFMESTESEINISKTNNQLGTDEKNNPVTCSPVFTEVSRAWLKNEFEKFWTEHGKQGGWFFYSWDNDNAGDEVLYVKFAKGFAYSPAYKNSNYADLSLAFEGQR